MNTTKRIEKTILALEKKQLKNALFLTDRPETERHHHWVEEAARTCLTNKGDKERCDAAIKEAKAKIVETITVPLDDTSLEGIEEMLEERADERDRQLDHEAEQVVAEKSDEELYENCPECHLADAAVKFAEISRHCTGEATELESLAADESTPPEKWLQEMKRIKENATCGQEAYQEVWNELTSYLKERDSPMLKGLEEANG
jgi:hypothetical protein